MAGNPPGRPPMGVDDEGRRVYREPMVNYAEVQLPDAARRGLARGIGKPTLLEKQVNGSHPRVQCPHCRAWRPSICIALTKGGWRCDGCISDARRHGTFEEW